VHLKLVTGQRVHEQRKGQEVHLDVDCLQHGTRGVFRVERF
jgi:hypothetical protein